MSSNGFRVVGGWEDSRANHSPDDQTSPIEKEPTLLPEEQEAQLSDQEIQRIQLMAGTDHPALFTVLSLLHSMQFQRAATLNVLQQAVIETPQQAIVVAQQLLMELEEYFATILEVIPEVASENEPQKRRKQKTFIPSQPNNSNIIDGACQFMPSHPQP